MHRARRRKVAATLLLTVGLSIGILSSPALAATDGSTPEQIGLAVTTNPQTSMNVNWTTINAPAADAQVKIWQSNTSESSAVSFVATADTRMVSKSGVLDPVGSPIAFKTFYSAELTGLKADTTYRYRVGAGEATSMPSITGRSSAHLVGNVKLLFDCVPRWAISELIARSGLIPWR